MNVKKARQLALESNKKLPPIIREIHRRIGKRAKQGHLCLWRAFEGLNVPRDSWETIMVLLRDQGFRLCRAEYVVDRVDFDIFWN